MILTEQTTIPAAVLPLDLLKDHLRLGTGFTSDTLQDDLLEAYLRAAVSAVEARTGLVLIERSFVWTLSGWRHYDRQELPVRPVQAITAVTLIDKNGGTDAVPATAFHLEKDAQAPTLVAVGVALPVVPTRGSVDVAFDAGFGPDWADLPADIARAVLLLAADFYENRNGREGAGLPAAVLALLEGFKKFRLGAA